MALGGTYVTLAELKAYLGVADTVDDPRLAFAINSASRGIDKVCGRTFCDAGAASARVYHADSWKKVLVDDFSTVAGLLVATDMDRDGTFEQTWTSSDYQCEPLNGVVNGEPGWPFWRLMAVGSLFFPSSNDPRSYQASRWNPWPRRASVQVTARWGWATVPDQVKQATFVVASEVFKIKDAPFGVAGFDQYGAVRVRSNPVASMMIAPYVRDPVLMA